ncbi:hypothetical protein OROMI_002141 [Orobanche minor]
MERLTRLYDRRGREQQFVEARCLCSWILNYARITT